MLRLRVTPFSELNGMGMLDAHSGRLSAALTKAVLTLSAAQRKEKSVVNVGPNPQHDLEGRVEELQRHSAMLEQQMFRFRTEFRELHRLWRGDSKMLRELRQGLGSPQQLRPIDEDCVELVSKL